MLYLLYHTAQHRTILRVSTVIVILHRESIAAGLYIRSRFVHSCDEIYVTIPSLVDMFTCVVMGSYICNCFRRLRKLGRLAHGSCTGPGIVKFLAFMLRKWPQPIRPSKRRDLVGRGPPGNADCTDMTRRITQPVRVISTGIRVALTVHISPSIRNPLSVVRCRAA